MLSLRLHSDGSRRFAARCHEAASSAAHEFEAVSDFVQERLRLAPRQAQVNERGDCTHKRSVKYEARADAPGHPQSEEEWQQGRGNQDGRQKGLLAKQVARGKDDGENEELRQESAQQYTTPMYPCDFRHIPKIDGCAMERGASVRFDGQLYKGRIIALSWFLFHGGFDGQVAPFHVRSLRSGLRGAITGELC